MSLLGVVVRFNVDTYLESENTLDEVHDLIKTLLDGSGDLLVHEDFPSLC